MGDNASLPLGTKQRKGKQSMTMFTGLGISVFQAKVLEHSLKLYADHGIAPTRGVGPKKMMALARQITGKAFKAREYHEAASELHRYCDVNAMLATANGEITNA